MAVKTYLKTTLKICAVLFLLAQPTFAALPRYEIVDLGTLGGDYSYARSINNNRQIVGAARNRKGAMRATLFDPTGGGNNVDLGTLGGEWSFARSINNNGQIVGGAKNISELTRATLFDPTGAGNNINLGKLDANEPTWNDVDSINDKGQIVGFAFTSSGQQHAVLFDSTGAGNNIDLGTLGGNLSFARSINNNGQIVGKARNSSQIQRATLFDPTGGGNNIDLGTLGGIYSEALSINDNGKIVGSAKTSSGMDHAALFDPTGTGNNIDLGTLDGAECWAESINNVGQIVGLTEDASGPEEIHRAVLIDSTGGENNIDLNTLIDRASGWTLKASLCINDNGWIGGYGINPVGETHAYLLIPKPVIIYVDADAAGANDGSSWVNAYNYLQDALAAAYSGDEIRVAQGIYTPDCNSANPNGSGDREATFQFINGVTLRGGYAGFGEPDPSAWDINAYKTILSGDLDGNDIEVNDSYDLLTEPSRAENSYHVVTGNGTDVTAVLDGFTITAGNANGPSFWPSFLHDRGGGIRHTGEPTIANCTFVSNSAEVYGGGIYNYGGTYGGTYDHDDEWPTLTNCKFIRNSAGYSGGGISTDTASAMITNCTFVGNCAASAGGGIRSHAYSCLALTNCTFKSNSAGGSGGGIQSMDDYGLTLTNCTFTGNSAMFGGGVYKNDDIECDNANLIVSNCTFTGNIATYECGGIFAGTALYCNQIITNSILWGNADSGGVDESAQVDLWGFVDYVNYNCIQGLTGTLGGIGNIDADPCFVDEANEDYHLLAGSPCIDAGDPNYIAEPNETDLDGGPRVINGRIDMGAYEAPIFAEARIVPNTINLASKGKWITCYIWLPEDYNVADIDPNSVYLEGEIKPEKFWLTEDNQIAIAKFGREDVQAILNIGEVNLTITGRLTDGTLFEGTDTIKVLNKAGKK